MGERFFVKKDLIVVDRETGLMWQREASTDPVVWKEGVTYIAEINASEFGGFSDWRYPTKDELTTIITQRENRETGLFIDSSFGKQRCCWTSTEGDQHQAVYADFYYGDLYLVQGNYANYYIRAVRNV